MHGGKIPLDPNSTKEEAVSEHAAKFMKVRVQCKTPQSCFASIA